MPQARDKMGRWQRSSLAIPHRSVAPWSAHIRRSEMATEYNLDGSVTCWGIADPSRTATYAGPRNSAGQLASMAAFYALEPPLVPSLSAAPVLGTVTTLFMISGANMNTTVDQAFSQMFQFTKYTPTLIIASNASISLTTAAGGIYTGAGKAGVVLSPATQSFSGLTNNTAVINPVIAVPGQRILSSTPPYLSLTTPQGAASTADFTIMGLAG
jgi:hypothetical protein